jgi:hypothetical protein
MVEKEHRQPPPPRTQAAHSQGARKRYRRRHGAKQSELVAIDDPKRDKDHDRPGKNGNRDEVAKKSKQPLQAFRTVLPSD